MAGPPLKCTQLLNPSTVREIFAQHLLERLPEGSEPPFYWSGAKDKFVYNTSGYKLKLRFNWLQNSPYLAKDQMTVENTLYTAVRPIQWRGQENPREPWVSLGHTYDTDPDHPNSNFRMDMFYQSAIKNYRLPPEVLEQMSGSNWGASARLDYGIVRDGHIDGFHVVDGKKKNFLEIMKGSHGTIVGTMRVFNGIPARQIFASGDRKIIESLLPELPLEKWMTTRNLPSKTVKKLEKQRAKNFYAEIFEIGRFSLSKDHPNRDDARALLELFLMTHYFEKYPNGDFYVHADTEAHAILYRRRYGFKQVEVVEGWDPETNIPVKEFILMQKGSELAAAIKRLYGL